MIPPAPQTASRLAGELLFWDITAPCATTRKIAQNANQNSRELAQNKYQNTRKIDLNSNNLAPPTQSASRLAGELLFWDIATSITSGASCPLAPEKARDVDWSTPHPKPS